MKRLVVAVIIKVMIGISSRLRGQKARTVNILAIDVAIDVNDYDKKQLSRGGG